MLRLSEDDPLAAAALAAIRSGAVEGLAQLLRDEPRASTLMLERRPRQDQPALAYPLIAATTDWPGHFPRVVESIRVLVAAGADVRVPCEGRHRETALHWAASSDDVDALDALLDAGADIEAPGAVIAGGTALDDAVAFAQWRAARRLVERGAQMAVWHAAALGRVELLAGYFAAGEPTAQHPWGASASRPRSVPDSPRPRCAGEGHGEPGQMGTSAFGTSSTPRSRPSPAVHIAFWCACHGGQRGAAEWLLARGADASWVAPWDGLTPLDAARRGGHLELVPWLESIGATAAGAH